MTPRLAPFLHLIAVLLLLAAPSPARTDESGGFGSLGALSDAMEAVVARINPAVVQIFATGYSANPLGGSSVDALVQKRQNTGSGVIVDPGGYIVTNAHVVLGAGRIQILMVPPAEETGDLTSILKPRGRLIGAQLVGVDRETDIAVLRIEGKDLPALPLGDSDEVSQGELVLAVGSPLGLESTVTIGVVSSVARQLRPEDPVVYLQTDATINPGNSGGPLVNTRGEIVGINTLILSQSGGSEGLGFAVPSNIVRAVYTQIRERGRVRRGHVGVRAQTITPLLAAGLGLPRDWGVIVGDVEPGSPAESAGLRIGDVILSMDDKPMENGRQFDVNLYGHAVGETVTLEIQRGSTRKSYRVNVIENVDDPLRFVERLSPDRNLVRPLGILGFTLPEEMIPYLPELRKRTGVVVAARAAGAPYWESGFQPGDIIHEVNGQLVRDLAELRRLVGGLAENAAAVVQVERDGRLLFIAIEVE